MKDRLDRWATALWSLFFGLLGRWRSTAAIQWQPVGGQHILVIAPHPDDESIGCAGTILSHRQAGDTVHLLIVTDGGRSRALGLNREEMVRRRQQEAIAAAAALDAKLIWLGLPEGAWSVEHLQTSLKEILEQRLPDYVYAPSFIDFHPQHEQVAQGIATVLPTDVAVRVYQVQTPLTAVLTNRVIDVTKWAGQMADLFALYQTQQGSLGHAMRQRHYAGRFYGNGRYVEAFWQMTGQQYRQRHDVLPEDGHNDYRGLRYRSFTDPLAYLIGQDARRRFKQAA